MKDFFKELRKEFKLWYLYLFIIKKTNKVYTIVEGERPGDFFAWDGNNTIPATGESRGIALKKFIHVNGIIFKIDKQKILIVTKIIEK